MAAHPQEGEKRWGIWLVLGRRDPQQGWGGWQVTSLPFSTPEESFPDAEQKAEADAGEPGSPGAVPHRAHGGHRGG